MNMNIAEILTTLIASIVAIAIGTFSLIIEIYSSKLFQLLLITLLIVIVVSQSKRIKNLEEKASSEIYLENIKNILENNLQYSTTHVYDAKGETAYEFTWKINDGHWAKSIYDVRGEGAFTVKHFRTSYASERDRKNRFEIDMAVNKKDVYGESRDVIVNGMKFQNGIYAPQNISKE